MNKRLISTAALALSGLLVSVASHATPPIAWKDGTNIIKFPNIDDSHFRNPSIIGLDHINAVDSNMSKAELVNLLGRPHYAEGAFGTTVWDYVFRMKQEDGSYKICQYQVHFDRVNENDAAHDSGRQLLTNKDLWTTCFPKAQPASQPPAKPAPQVINLSADALFAFNGGQLKDLKQKGRDELDNMTNMLSATYAYVNSIKIVGHTDRLGSVAYNNNLSRQRANTVRDYIVSRGIPSNSITTDGLGKSQPVFECSNTLARQALIDCLGPNRRVSIQIDGVQRVTIK